MWKGTCPDECCRQVLVFTNLEEYVTCFSCGQARIANELHDKIPYNPAQDRVGCIVRTPCTELNVPQRNPDLVKVMGFSHYHHKLISPLLTTHGMDKHTGKPRTLRQLTGRCFLDCSVFGDRNFKIESRHLNIIGYGKDPLAFSYLQGTLEQLLQFNNFRHNLMPIHSDGDGHCLVHSVSRALVGRELFWHPLRIGLKYHFNMNLEKYKSLLGNFISNSEWPAIIDECEPEYKPLDGSMVGLRNIHVFALANLLRRPIILLDSEEGMRGSADYAAVFLPGLNPPMACCNQSGQLNPPLCLGWANPARNHYVPIVPIKELPLPRFPKVLLPKVWGFSQDLIDTYMQFDETNCVIVGSDNYLAQPYIAKLTNAMDELFAQRNQVPLNVVEDVYLYYFSSKLMNRPRMDAIAHVAKTTLEERRLWKCIKCSVLCVVPINSHWFKPGGLFYNKAQKLSYGTLKEGHIYDFLNYNMTCMYNKKDDTLAVASFVDPDPCPFCHQGKLRAINKDGSLCYQEGDRTVKPITEYTKYSCYCGFWHYYNGELHSTVPINLTGVFDWRGIVKKVKISWFSAESEARLNSDVFKIANSIAAKFFPDERDPELLKKYIIEVLLELTKDLHIDEEDDSQKSDLSNENASCADNIDLIGLTIDKESRKRPFDSEVEGPNPKISHLDEGNHSPKPSTSRLSPKYP